MTRARDVLLLALAYYATARLGLALAWGDTHASPVWPPSGVAVGALVLFGRKLWPGVWLGAFCANLLGFELRPASVGTSALIACGNTGEALLAARILGRWAPASRFFDRTSDVAALVGAAAAASLLACAVGLAGLAAFGLVPWSASGTVAWTWWLGDVTGILVVTPLLIAWRRRGHRARSAESAVLFALLTGVALAVFATGFRLPFVVLMPFSLWAAFRLGPRSITGVLTLVSVLAIAHTVNGRGPFVGPTRNDSLLHLQSFLAVFGVTTMAIAAAVAQRRAVRSSLARKADELEQLAYVVSHDLQEPMRQVASWCELLASRYGESLDETARRYLRHAVEGGRRGQRLVRDLLDHFRAGVRQREPVDLNGVVGDVAANLGANGAVRSDPLPTVVANRTGVTVLLQNLVSNGLRYRRDVPPHVRISATRERHAWRVSVADNGRGIPAVHHDDAFEFGWRANGEGEGTGIGLASCRRAVEALGGRIWFDSEPGVGTTFHFTIPDRRHV